MTTAYSLASKIALVTGAASGIGKASALMLARHGARVICADLNVDGAATTAAAIGQAGGQASAAKLDVTVESDWEALLSQVVQDHGRVDILVNCAGVAFASQVVDMSLAEWRRVFSVNVDGVFLGTKHAVRTMRAAGGSIVHISSASAIRPAPGASVYSASKAAVCMFARTAAKECRANGLPIRINTVCPGGVKTPIWSAMPFFRDMVNQTGSEEKAYEILAGGTPGSRFAEPEEVAAAVLYLVSDEAKYVTGLDLVIDNGYVL